MIRHFSVFLDPSPLLSPSWIGSAGHGNCPTFRRGHHLLHVGVAYAITVVLFAQAAEN